MKKIYLLLICLLICGCQNNNSENILVDDEEPTEIVESYVDNIINNMTIEEKIGQMLIISYASNIFDDDLLKVFNDIKPGGFIIFDENISSFENTKKFIKDLKEHSDNKLIVAIDEEGGSVQKLQLINDKEVLFIPSMYDVGKTNNEELAYDIGVIIAQQLKTLGINVTFAPVLDINNNLNNKTIGKRSFGNNKFVVSKMANNVAKGLENTGIIPTFKHFPGHGDTEVNSHISLPVINKDYNELYQNELVPFIDAINNTAKMIMVGHLAFPKITDDYIPASLSKKMINDILIDKLDYKGLIITDALNMGALTENYSDEEITIMAIESGADLLLMPRDYYETVNYIKNNISEQRIDKSVRKILSFKFEYLKDYPLLDESYLNNDFQKEVIRKLSED